MKISIERGGVNEAPDEDFTMIWFTDSSIFLIHPYILARYPNIEEVKVERSKIDDLNNPIENCQNIKRLSLELNGVTEISSNLFNNCQKLEKIEIKSNSLEDLPDDIFQNQPNLK
jgi:Leucine-rich repeat (LRR) protein